MQVTRATEYGLLAALYLARQAPHRLVMIEEMSASENIPRSFLAKIVQSLAHAGLVESQRGVGGGFRLARPANTITVQQLMEAIEGSLALKSCTENEPVCVWDQSRIANCTVCALFTEAQARVLDLFANTTLADLIKPRPALAEELPAHGKRGATVPPAATSAAK